MKRSDPMRVTSADFVSLHTLPNLILPPYAELKIRDEDQQPYREKAMQYNTVEYDTIELLSLLPD